LGSVLSGGEVVTVIQIRQLVGFELDFDYFITG
jgi:hypothetical protein